MVSLDSVKDDEELTTFIDSANVQLAALGYTEHGRRHAGLVAKIAGDILETLGYSGSRCGVGTYCRLPA